ncbi:glycosyltransferase family 4 protein [Paradevosia shaoguanensis]|uniref:glycosyltransferase family 4 protein n=1 Tax=Paradevosia shaoguanensis TaxID=1335043 RepID=UPI003C77CED9
MRILIVSQYFWPENFRVNDLSADLVERGHSVTVLAGLPNYPDGVVFPDYLADPGAFAAYRGADVVRVPLLPRGNGGLQLMLNYLSFAVTASLLGPFKLRGRPFDAIFVFQGSPVTVGFPAIVLKWLKKAPIALWVLDLWPQSLKAVGAVQSGFVLGMIDRLVTFIYRNCDMVLGQSRSFLPELTRHVVDPKKVSYLPSWSDATPEQSAPLTPAAEVEQRQDQFSIVFTGNIGEAQDFGAVLEAAELLREQAVRWIIVGDGRQADWLRSQIVARGLTEQVVMPGRFPLERMPSFFAHADALLVCLKASPVFAMTIPGKVQSYLAAGLPILAMLDGEGAAVIKASKAGYAAPAGDAAALAQSVRDLMALPPAERHRMGQLGAEYAAKEFDRNTLLSRIETTLSDLANRRTDR